MVNGESAREQLLETIRSIETQTLINMILIFFAAYVLGRIVTSILLKASERMSRSGRVKVKMIIPAVKFGIYVIALYYFLTQIFKIFGPELFLLIRTSGRGHRFWGKGSFCRFYRWNCNYF